MAQTFEGASLEAARAAKKEASEVFSSLASVNGIGIVRAGEGYGLKVNLSAAPPESVDLPESINGVPVRVEIVGAITKR